MKRFLVAAAALVVLVPSVSAAAQQLGLAARFGTLGLGGEASIGVNRFLAVRGGIGALPVHVTGLVTDVEYRVSPPGSVYNVSLDIFPLGGDFRVSGGFLFKPRDIALRAIYTGTVTVNGQTYQGSEVGTLTGALDHRTTAPYATIGWGRAATHGVGFFVDLGAAAIGTPTLALNVTGPASQDAQFRQDLEAERVKAEDKIAKYARVWPILSMGVRVGVH